MSSRWQELNDGPRRAELGAARILGALTEQDRAQIDAHEQDDLLWRESSTTQQTTPQQHEIDAAPQAERETRHGALPSSWTAWGRERTYRTPEQLRVRTRSPFDDERIATSPDELGQLVLSPLPISAAMRDGCEMKARQLVERVPRLRVFHDQSLQLCFAVAEVAFVEPEQPFEQVRAGDGKAEPTVAAEHCPRLFETLPRVRGVLRQDLARDGEREWESTRRRRNAPRERLCTSERLVEFTSPEEPGRVHQREPAFRRSQPATSKEPNEGATATGIPAEECHSRRPHCGNEFSRQIEHGQGHECSNDEGVGDSHGRHAACTDPG